MLACIRGMQKDGSPVHAHALVPSTFLCTPVPSLHGWKLAHCQSSSPRPLSRSPLPQLKCQLGSAVAACPQSSQGWGSLLASRRPTSDTQVEITEQRGLVLPTKPLMTW